MVHGDAKGLAFAFNIYYILRQGSEKETGRKRQFSQRRRYWSATRSVHRSEGPQGPVCKHCEKKLVSNTWPENSDRVASNLAALHKNPPLLPAPLQFYFSLCTNQTL